MTTDQGQRRERGRAAGRPSPSPGAGDDGPTGEATPGGRSKDALEPRSLLSPEAPSSDRGASQRHGHPGQEPDAGEIELWRTLAETMRRLCDGRNRLGGKALFDAMVTGLAGAFEADVALVAKLVADQPEIVRTISLCAEGELRPNLEYPLSGTPCEQVLTRRACCHPAGVANSFPSDPMLAQGGIEGYAGVPLFGVFGQPLGVLCLLFRRPIANPVQVEAGLLFFAATAAAEVERMQEEQQCVVLAEAAEACARDAERADAALRRSEQRYHALVESAHDVMFEVDCDGRLRFVSASVAPVLGYQPERLVGRPMAELVDPAHRLEFDADLEQAVGGHLASGEYRLIRSSGEPAWARFSWRKMARGALESGAQGTFVDITASRRAAEEARSREEALAGFFEVAPIGLAVVRDGCIDRVNDRFCEIVGRAQGELVGCRARALFDSDGQLGSVAAEVRSQLERGFKFSIELALRKADGQPIAVQCDGARLDPRSRHAYALAIQDVTERRRVQETTERLRRTQRTVLDAAGEGIIGLDEDGRQSFVNVAAAELLGYAPDDLVGLHSHEVWHHTKEDGSWYPAEECSIYRAFRNGRVHRAQELFWRRDGTSFLAEYVCTPILTDGEPTGAVVVFSDVTEQRASKEERERLVMAIEQSSEVVVVTDPTGTITYVNPSFERVTGYTRQEAVGRNPRILKSGAQSAAFYQELWETITRGETWRGRFVNQRKDGSRYTEDATITPVRDSDGRVQNYVAVKRDVTKELGLAEQLLHAQKMEAIGKLAGGVAHDINNMLATILVTASLLESGLGPDHPNAHDVDAIAEACRRGRELTRNLLGFSGKAALTRGPLNVNDVVKHCLLLLQPGLLQRVKVEVDLATNLWSVVGDSGQITQALMNVCLNAADAMPSGGVLTIRTRNSLGVERRSADAAIAGPCVHLEVSDTGIGMDDECLKHAFEPFFTTKPQDKGTGLGLAMVYGTMLGHGGSVEIESTVGQGTTVTLVLPSSVVRANTEPPAPRTARVSGAARGGVLLIDDEGAILKALSNVLRLEGFQVWVASTGAEALDVYGRHRESIGAVVLDLVMPEMAGPDIMRALRKMDPSVAVVVSSGYAHETTTRQVQQMGAAAFIPKPFEPDVLVERILEVMRGVPGQVPGPSETSNVRGHDGAGPTPVRSEIPDAVREPSGRDLPDR